VGAGSHEDAAVGRGRQGGMMSQLGLAPSAMSGSGGLGGLGGGLPGGLDPSQLKGMDMKKLMEMAKKFR